MRIGLFLIPAFFVLTACGDTRTPEPSGDAVARAADVAAEATEVAEMVEPAEVAEVVETDLSDVPNASDAHAHEADHDSHAHDAHEDHEGHAGGTAHTHGGGDLAVVVENGSVSVELQAPLANFGLAEAGDALFTDLAFATFLDERDALLTLEGDGACGLPAKAARIEAHGDHGEGHVSWAFDCAESGRLTGLTLGLFDVFPGFEEIDAIVFVDGSQRAAELTPARPSLTFAQ